MIYHTYKGIGLSFINENTDYMHLDYADSFYIGFDLNVKTSDLLGLSSKEISKKLDDAYVHALTVEHAKKIRLKAQNIRKNGIFQFAQLSTNRDGEKIKYSLRIKVYDYKRTNLASKIEYNRSLLNNYRMKLNELSILSLLKKRSIQKEILSLEKYNDELLKEEINRYKQWFIKEFSIFKLSESLLDELMDYAVIFAKKDILKTFILLDTIVEKFYSFKLSVEELEFGSLQLMIDSSVEKFTDYIKNKIKELHSYDISMVHGEMVDNLNEEQQKELDAFKKAFFNE